MRSWFPLLWLMLLLQGIPASLMARVAPETVKITEIHELKSDSSTLKLRQFEAQRLNGYRKDPAFSYKEGAVPVNGLWERFWSWVWQLVSKVFRKGLADGSSSAKFIKYIGLGLLVILIGFLITRLVGLNIKIFSRKSEAIAVPYVELEDNIHEIDFSTALEKAVTAGNYRLAIRLFYLQSLKQLTDRRMIDWQPEKTNQAYVNELKDVQRKQQFRHLTLQFEYIWYGEFFIDENSFTEVRVAFESFNKELA